MEKNGWIGFANLVSRSAHKSAGMAGRWVV